jgi:hypothetical protein
VRVEVTETTKVMPKSAGSAGDDDEIEQDGDDIAGDAAGCCSAKSQAAVEKQGLIPRLQRAREIDPAPGALPWSAKG